MTEKKHHLQFFSLIGIGVILFSLLIAAIFISAGEKPDFLSSGNALNSGDEVRIQAVVIEDVPTMIGDGSKNYFLVRYGVEEIWAVYDRSYSCRHGFWMELKSGDEVEIYGKVEKSGDRTEIVTCEDRRHYVKKI